MLVLEENIICYCRRSTKSIPCDECSSILAITPFKSIKNIKESYAEEIELPLDHLLVSLEDDKKAISYSMNEMEINEIINFEGYWRLENSVDSSNSAIIKYEWIKLSFFSIMIYKFNFLMNRIRKYVGD